MKTLTFTVPSDNPVVEIHIFADEHIGDAHCDMNRLKERINTVLNTENAVCILNGDIFDCTTRLSIGDIEGRKLNVMEQLNTAVELFKPLAEAGKIICSVSGNHEARTYNKEGIDSAYLLANSLGVTYAKESALIFLQYGVGKHYKKGEKNTACSTIYCTHGSGGGRKEGGKAIRLADLASIVDADVYIHGHTHLPMIIKEGFFRVNSAAHCVTLIEKLFVNGAANLDYGGYGEAYQYKPSAKSMPTIFLEAYDGRKKTWAKL